MIIKLNTHDNGAHLAAYLMKLAGYLDKENSLDEKAITAQIRGFASDNLHDALRDIQLEAAMTKCTRPILHCQIRLQAHERLTEKQWFKVIDRVEKTLGIDGQPRVVVWHENIHTGERHAHVAWSRIDREKHIAIKPGMYKNKLCELARTLERELGLEVVQKKQHSRDRTAAPRKNEYAESHRLQTDIKEIRENIRECFDRSDTGKAFKAALAEHNYTLAKGDRRDFVVIDNKGGIHALGKRILGVGAEELRERFKDINHLPTIVEVRERLELQQKYTAAKSRTERVSTRAVGDVASKGIHRAARTAETILSGLTSIVGGGDPQMTKQQMKDFLQSEGNIENQHARANASAQVMKDATYEHADDVRKSDRQAKEVEIAQKTGRNATAEAALHAEEQEETRRRERGRSR